jgi:hypothetical protein
MNRVQQQFILRRPAEPGGGRRGGLGADDDFAFQAIVLSNWPSSSRFIASSYTRFSIRAGVGSVSARLALSTASAIIITAASRVCGFGPG